MMRSAWWLFSSALVTAALVGGGVGSERDTGRKPQLAPLPQAAPEPHENPSTPEKVALGKQLFFDPRLSGDNTLSCASCHLPEKGLSDGLPTGKGFQGKSLTRNSPSLWNVGFQTSLFWDGRAASLEEQALAPIQSPEEMNQDLDGLERELNAVPGYVRQFQAVFRTPVTRGGIAQALAAFERTLVTGPSAFDRYLQGDKDALSAAARRGLELFTGDAECVRCHHGPLLSDGKFYRIGVSFRDPGRGGVSGDENDNFKFRTPSLRNVALTAPYMHDGSKRTLDEVVSFYFRDAPTVAPDGHALDVTPLYALSFSDIAALVEFLKSLSGEAPTIEPPSLP